MKTWRANMPALPPDLHSIREQLAEALGLIERHLAPLQAVHLYGSALDGGLKPHSDIDLLVTLRQTPEPTSRRALLLDLLSVSAPPGESAARRPLEVTVLVLTELRPWRYPPRRELQFGEWLRAELLEGKVEPPVADGDLAILITQARAQSLALVGPPASQLFEPVPERDFRRALADTLDLWNSPGEWAGDERNVLLTVARLWYSAATGAIAPKDVAADWLLPRLPPRFRPLLREARQGYLGLGGEQLETGADEISAFLPFARAAILELLGGV